MQAPYYEKHLQKLREFYAKGKYEEGWEYALKTWWMYPEEVQTKLFVEFAAKILGIEK